MRGMIDIYLMALPDEAAAAGDSRPVPAMKKPRWTKEEEAVLKEQVKVHGLHNWAAISEALPGRSPNSCRRRWCQHLKPAAAVNANRPFTTQEDEKIMANYHKFANEWDTIAVFLPGRTANAIKNRWYSVLSKVYRQQHGAAAKRCLPDGALVLFPLAPGDVKAFDRDMMIPPPGVDLSDESLNSSGEMLPPVERKLFAEPTSFIPNKRRAKNLKEPLPEESLRRSKRLATKAGGYKKESAVEMLNPKPLAIIPPPALAPYPNKDIIVTGIPICFL